MGALEGETRGVSSCDLFVCRRDDKKDCFVFFVDRYNYYQPLSAESGLEDDIVATNMYETLQALSQVVNISLWCFTK